MEFLEFFAGVFLGVIAGFLPGLHPNNISSVIAQLGMTNEGKTALLIGMFPANLIASFVPAIFFGIPEGETVLAALPGQRMTLSGEGLTALKTMLLSAIAAAFLSLLLFIPSMLMFPYLQSALGGYIKYIVLVLAVVLVARSKNMLTALLIFIAAGALGYFSLNSQMPDPFMPLFSGMFAIAALLNITGAKIPAQKKEGGFRKELLAFILLGVFLGMFADLLPGISSPAQVAFFATAAVPFNSLSYLATVSSIGVSQAIFSLATAATIGKSRIGTTAWLTQFADVQQDALLLAVLFVFGAALASVAVWLLRKKAANLAVLNARPIGWLFIAYLALVCFLLDGWLGLLVLVLASALGWLTLRLDVERTQMMGAVIVPTLLLLFGLTLF
ncbi:MAG: tripartite tricarboxylate transporter permease [Candidatus Micrarchaeota archaeon]